MGVTCGVHKGKAKGSPPPLGILGGGLPSPWASQGGVVPAELRVHSAKRRGCTLTHFLHENSFVKCGGQERDRNLKFCTDVN